MNNASEFEKAVAIVKEKAIEGQKTVNGQNNVEGPKAVPGQKAVSDQKVVHDQPVFDHQDIAFFKKTLDILKRDYGNVLGQNLKIDMQRGKPCVEQLELANEMLDWNSAPFKCEDGTESRNYGGDLCGIPECRKLFADLAGVKRDNVLISGNSSLSVMYDFIVKAMLLGVYGAEKPWLKYPGKLKFLCPSPGYDRHFKVTEVLGFDLVTVRMNPDGPDMDEVERFVNCDDSVVGIWNVPKYSNPEGITYSDNVVKRFAALKPKADGFRIFWDNSYFCHDLYEEGDVLLNLLEECKKNGNENMAYIFLSTSKITFAGSGVSVAIASESNIKHIKSQIATQTIGPDKINQLRHARYIKNAETLKKIMMSHAAIIRPKFECARAVLEEEFSENGLCQWNNPRGGYFISLNAPDGCATRAVSLAAQAGVLFTGAGSTFPYKKDPNDRNIRIAPTVPSVAEISEAIKTLSLCIKIAYLEKQSGSLVI